MSSGLHFFRRLCIVDNGDQPVTVPSDVKGHISIDVIGILKHAANFVKIVPANPLDNTHPRFDFVRCIGIAFHRLAEVLSRNDEHLPRILHNM